MIPNPKSLFFSTLLFLLTTGCAQLESIPSNPPVTPEKWLEIQPVLDVHLFSQTTIFVQPSTSIIVYLLGLITIGAGWYFWHIRGEHRSRLWWGIALALWGTGAILAGTSYEAFSYQIKCANREICIWTSWWEITYLLLSVASLDAMMIALAFACSSSQSRKRLICLAVSKQILYLLIVLVGVLIPIKFLISFEMLILVTAPNVIVFLVLNGWRYYKLRQSLDRVLLIIWGWLILTIGAYFLYYLSGLTGHLWQKGFWFSENDVLHIGLILWMIYMVSALAPKMVDYNYTSANLEADCTCE